MAKVGYSYLKYPFGVKATKIKCWHFKYSLQSLGEIYLWKTPTFV